MLSLSTEVIASGGKPKDVYISRYIGEDAESCGTKELPCKTLARGIETADWNARIFLDGTFNCTRNTVNSSGIRDENRITVNVSLRIVSFSSPARVKCGDWIQFVASHSKVPRMYVTFTGIAFHNTSLTFMDSSVHFVNCSFVGSVHAINFFMLRETKTSVTVKNSSFLDNTGCLMLEVSNPVGLITATLVSVVFNRNRPPSRDEGSGLNVRGASSASSQEITIVFNSTTFSDNEGPLVTNNMAFSKANESYHRIKFFKTALPLNSYSTNSVYFSKAKSGLIIFNDLRCNDNINTRCIHVKSSEVSVRILNSEIISHELRSQFGAGVFIEAVKSINLFLSGTTLKRNKGKSGGAIAVKTFIGKIHLQINNCSFLNNSANDSGGTLFITTPNGLATIKVANTVVEHSSAGKNGGALYISTNRKSVINAFSSRWAYNRAEAGAAIFVSSAIREERMTDLKVLAMIRNCQFISNNNRVDRGSLFIKAAIGGVRVFQTEWFNDTSCFYVHCNCFVVFTEVNISSTSFTAVQILSSGNNKFNNTPMKINFERCLFDLNKGDHLVVDSRNLHLNLTFSHLRFNGKKMLAKKTKSVINIQVGYETTSCSRIRLYNVTVKNAVGSAAVIFRIMSQADNKLEISDCVFQDIKSINSDKYHTMASPVSFWMQFDYLSQNVCKSEHLSYVYRNEIVITNTEFKNNIGRISGGVVLFNGNMTIRNSCFKNNYAIKSGGHIHLIDGTAMIKIENSTLIQGSPETVYEGETFRHDTSIYSESDGSIVLQESLVTAELELDSYRIFTVSKAGQVIFNNMTKLQCAVGSYLRFDNFSHFTVLTGLSSRKGKCRFKTTVMSLTCYSCSPGLYSLKRGQLIGLPEKQKLQEKAGSFCLPCPHGANCSRNVFAQPNFWGYPDSNNPGSLKFAHCPPNYCNPTGKQNKNLSVYNSCYGNRDGVVCGRCRHGYTETLFSTKCRQNEKCKDHWIWLLLLTYPVVMALFLIHQPPIIEILVKNIFWFKKVSRNRMEYESLDQKTKYNRGYTKIIFYFYQIASYLVVKPLSDGAKKFPFVSFFSGLLNFRPRATSGGLGCPFSGINVVTKELFLSLEVFATLLSVPTILLIHLAFNKFTRRPQPSMAPYAAASLEILLLGYATMANTCLKLLTCEPVLGESRLYYDANIKCLEWWQYIFIIYIVVFLLPFVIVIYWGAMKLRRKLIGTKHFIGACFFPLGFLFFWLIQMFAFPPNHRQVSDGANKREQKVLKVLHDPFRPPSPHQVGSLYWESVLIGRRFLLLSYQVFFPDPLLRLFCMNMTCLLIFAGHVAIKPFRGWKANIIEAVSLAGLVVIATINLSQAVLLSASINPGGPVKRHLIKLEQVEIFLLGVVPFLFSFLCLFAVLSQLARIFVLFLQFLRYVWYRICACLILRRMSLQVHL